MQYTPVPEAKQASIKQPSRAEWFTAMLDHGMLEMNARPTLSQAQKMVLIEQGQRMRTRSIDGKFYVWVEDAPDGLPESAQADDMPDPFEA